MPRDAIFAIASMTKPITGVAALSLWEEGRFGLADPIERFLPKLGNPKRGLGATAVHPLYATSFQCL